MEKGLLDMQSSPPTLPLANSCFSNRSAPSLAHFCRYSLQWTQERPRHNARGEPGLPRDAETANTVGLGAFWRAHELKSTWKSPSTCSARATSTVKPTHIGNIPAHTGFGMPAAHQVTVSSHLKWLHIPQLCSSAPPMKITKLSPRKMHESRSCPWHL